MQPEIITLPIWSDYKAKTIARWSFVVGCTESEAFDTAPVVIKQIFWEWDLPISKVLEWLQMGWSIERIKWVTETSFKKYHWQRMQETEDDYKKRISARTRCVSSSCDCS